MLTKLLTYSEPQLQELRKRLVPKPVLTTYCLTTLGTHQPRAVRLLDQAKLVKHYINDRSTCQQVNFYNLIISSFQDFWLVLLIAQRLIIRDPAFGIVPVGILSQYVGFVSSC